MPIVKINITPIPQTGQICKPTALAAIEKYYALKMNFNAIPLNKRNNPLHSHKKHTISMRQLAKLHGSVQGELLQIQQVTDILKEIGYTSSIIDFKNKFELFKATIIENITAGNLIFAAFSVNRDQESSRYGHPTTDPRDAIDRNEHAAVIHGYDTENEIIYITHWGKEWRCSFLEFYNASMVLLETREAEHYKDVKSNPSDKRYKYDLLEEVNAGVVEDTSHKIKKSIIPKENTGFCAKLIVIESPQIEQIHAARVHFVQALSVPPPTPRLKLTHNASKPIKDHCSQIKHFAHVFLDGEINNTPLEGFSIESTLSYVEDFLDYLQASQTVSDPLQTVIRKLASTPSLQQKHFFSTLHNQLFMLQRIEENKTAVLNKFQGKNDITMAAVEHALTAVTEDILTMLEDQRDIFFKGGWGGHPGHILMYRMSIQKDGTYFCVYDSSSIEYESTLESSAAPQYYPLYAFNIPHSVNKHRISQFIVRLLKFETLPSLNPTRFCYIANDLYDVLHSAPTWFNGPILSPSKLSRSRPTQRSGTCAWRAIQHWWEATIQEYSAYRQFLLAYRLFYFQKTLTSESFSISLPGVKVLLKRGLANMIRMLDSELKAEVSEWVLNEQDKAEIITEAKRWKSALESKEPKLNYRVKTHSLASSVMPTVSTTFKSKLELISTEIAERPAPDNTSFKSLENKPFTEILIILNQWLQIPYLNNSIYINWIEEFCFYFTNPHNSLRFENSIINLDQQKTIIDLLSAILAYYSSYQQKITSHSVVIYLSLICIVDRLGQEKIFHFGDHILSNARLHGKLVHQWIQSLTHNPFLSTFNPRLDCLWDRLRQFYNSDMRLTLPLVYYSGLIRQANDSEKKILLEQWEIISGEQQESVELVKAVNQFFNFPGGHPSYYCYLNQKERESIHDALPELNKVFGVQVALETFFSRSLQAIAQFASEKRGATFPISSNLDIDITQKRIYPTSSTEEKIELKLKGFFTSEECYLVLDRALQPLEAASSIINRILLSDYDTHRINSQEVPYHVKQYSASNLPPTYNSKPLLQHALSSEEQLACLLVHLRVSTECQVIAILSELLNHPTWLLDDELKAYILLSTFQPGALLSALRQGSGLWTLLTALWDKNKNGHFAAAFFILKLATLISNYVLEASQHDIYTLEDEELQFARQWQKTMLETVDKHLEQPKSEIDLNLMNEWHYWRLSVLLKLHTGVSADWESRFLSSYWFSVLHFSGLNTNDAMLCKQALKQARTYFSSVKNVAEKSLQTVQLLLDNEHFNLDKQTIVIDDIDLQVKIDGKFLGSLPGYIQDRPECHELFGKRCNVLATKKYACINEILYEVYEWEINSQLYRALFCQEHRDFILQKQLHQEWYAYSVPSQRMQQGSRFSQYAFTELPALLEQKGYRVWIANQDHWMVVASDSQKILYTQEGENCYAGEPHENVRCKLGEPKDIPHCFFGFEDAKFIRVLDSEKGKRWHLERYNLEFVPGDEPHTYQTNDKCYTIHSRSNKFGSGLLLQHKRHGTYFLMIPIQPYYLLRNDQGQPTPLEAHNHYVWAHDLSNHLVQKYHDEKKSEQDIGWEHANSERYALYQIPAPDQEPIANSPRDQLYLAYLYLVQDRPKKAMQCLRHCIMQGTCEEMELLWWIVKKLPADSIDAEAIKNSRVIAVQMVALGKMLQLKKQFSSWNTSTEKSNTSTDSNTMLYKTKERLELSKFVNSLPHTLEIFYTCYNRLLNNIPSGLRLNCAEEKLILSYCMAAFSGEKHLYGVLGAHYLKHFPNAEITAYHQIHYHKMQAIRFYIYPWRWLDDLTYLDESQRAYFDLQTPFYDKSIDALHQLHPYMEPDALLRQFATFYRLAICSQDDVIRKDLKHFCEASLAYHKRGTNKSSLIFILVSEILWTVLHAPESFPLNYEKPRYKGQTILALIKIAKKIENCPSPTPRILRSIHQYQAAEPLQAELKKTAPMPLAHSEETSEPLFPWSTLYQAIHFKQLRIFEQFSYRQNLILEQIKTIPQGAYGPLKKTLATLDEQFLELQQDILRAQEQAYDNIVVEHGFDSSNPFGLEKKTLQAVLSVTVQLIQSILQRRRQSGIVELGKRQITPTIEALLSTYPTLQTNDLLTMGILSEDIETLNKALQTLLLLYDGKKRLTLIEEAFQNYQREPTPLRKKRLIQALFNTQKPSSKHEAVFQYVNQMALRPEQQQFIRAIFNPSQAHVSKVLQLAMGGGKTKIVLPLWAYEVADGDRLAIVLVPDMSLQTNFADLATTSLRTFNQEPYCLSFHRKTSDDPASLQELYETIETVRYEKRYIISTESTWQSLELKYLELLNHSPKTKFKRHSQQLFWLGKLLNLVREKGIAAIDEAHALLHIKKALTYEVIEETNTTHKKSIFIDIDIIRTTADLYLWLSAHPNSILEYLKNPEPIMDSSAIIKLMADYIESLCQATQNVHAPSWIKGLLVESVSKEELFNYLSDSSTDLPKHLRQEPKLKQQWLLLRIQFQTMLPLTLRRKLFEHYGPLPNSDTPFAIPYRANNAPTEFVFGHFMEAIDYTTQMMLHMGLTETDLKTLLTQWQEESYIERRENGNTESSTEQQFALIFPAESFKPLLKSDLTDPVLFKKLYDHGHHNPYLISKAIQRCLQRLVIEPKSLSSDPINLVSMFNRVIALTGTPSNHNTFHQDMQLMYETTLGVDAQIRQYLVIKSIPIDYTEPQKIKPFLAQKMRENEYLRAFIDHGGFFRGIDNVQAANILAEMCATYLPEIQYILFYKNNQLCALDIRAKLLSTLSSTDPYKLEEQLKCSANQRFTYYDQEHTLGIDISQSEHAHGILTVDVVQGVLSQMLQAAMRMRGLGEQQSLVIVVNKPNLSLDDLFQQLSENEDQRLAQEHFWAGLKKIHNLFRNDLLQRLLSETNESTRDRLFQKSISFFLNEQTCDLLSLDKKSDKQSTTFILRDFAQKRRALWAKILEIKEPVPLDTALESIIEQTIKICPDAQLLQNFQPGSEVQQQRQHETQKEQEQLDEKNTTSVALRPIDCSWITMNNTANLLSLNAVVSRQYPNLSWQFSPNLYASPNFLYSYVGQQDIYGAYTKPAIAMLFIWRKHCRIDGILICMEEAEHVLKYLSSRTTEDVQYYCLSLNGAAYHSMPKPLGEEQRNEIDELLCQAQFATGKINALREKPLPVWFKDQPEEKIQFLEKITPFVNLDAESLACFHHRLMTTKRYLQAWVKSSQTPEIFIQDLIAKQVADNIIVRLRHVIPQLEATRACILGTSHLATLPTMNFHGELDEAVFFRSYRTSLEWIKVCSTKNISDAIAFYVKNQNVIDTTCFDYYFPEVDLEQALKNAEKIHQVLSHYAVQHFFTIFTQESPFQREGFVLNFEDYLPILDVLYKSSTQDQKAACIILENEALINSYSNNELLIYLLTVVPAEHLQQLFTNFERNIAYFEFLFAEDIRSKTIILNIILWDPTEIDKAFKRIAIYKDVLKKIGKQTKCLLSEFSLLELDIFLDKFQLLEPAINTVYEGNSLSPVLFLFLVKIININPHIILEEITRELISFKHDIEKNFDVIHYFLPMFCFEDMPTFDYLTLDIDDLNILYSIRHHFEDPIKVFEKIIIFFSTRKGKMGYIKEFSCILEEFDQIMNVNDKVSKQFYRRLYQKEESDYINFKLEQFKNYLSVETPSFFEFYTAAEQKTRHAIFNSLKSEASVEGNEVAHLTLEPGNLKNRIEEWLEKNKISISMIYGREISSADHFLSLIAPISKSERKEAIAGSELLPNLFTNVGSK